MNRQNTEGLVFRVVKLFSNILQWWIHVIVVHLPKLIECTTLRVNANVSCGLGDNDVSVSIGSSAVTNAPPEKGMFIVGEVIHVCGRKYMTTHCSFC